VSLARTLLLKASDSAWLREHGTKAPFVRRAARRFMPGESLDDMLAAAKVMAGQGIQAVFTRLGENVTDLAEADAVARHYVEALERVGAERIVCEPSVKLTQLGLDIESGLTMGHLRDLASRAYQRRNYLWVDMEQSSYVGVTLDLVRRLAEDFPNVGVCLQAYLRRTRQDLVDLMGRGVGIRLVKGAYREPASVAFPRKSEVDANYLALAQLMLEPGARSAGSRVVFGTHDLSLIAAIRQHAGALSVKPSDYEVHMLYGIQRAAQLRLAREGATVRVLIAYGPCWFPWYMRRLAERPANAWFVVRSVVGG
jgi:proline dehydrogenase